jgi:hypothetical protein
MFLQNSQLSILLPSSERFMGVQSLKKVKSIPDNWICAFQLITLGKLFLVKEKKSIVGTTTIFT